MNINSKLTKMMSDGHKDVMSKWQEFPKKLPLY